jgi:hypothetical protein
MRRSAVVAVAFALCPAAPAEAEPGFHLSPELSPRASRVAGLAARVYCANDSRAWSRFVARRGFRELGSVVYAMTDIAHRETFVAPRICNVLRHWLSGQPVPLAPLADAVFTFTHEAAHLSGIPGECAADRWAFARLARVARTEFGVARPARVRELVRLARQSSGYVETC